MDTGLLPPCFLALSESRELASAVGRSAGLELASLEERRFEGGEFKLRPLESVRGRTAFVLQSLAGTADTPVSDRFLRLLFLLHGLHDAGASQRVALVPYMAFARKDRRTQPRDPVNTRYVAQLLEASRLDRLIALDVHNPAALDNSFRSPVDHLTALPMMVDHFASCENLAGETLAVASPDVGGVKRVQIFRELLESRLGREVELVFVEKRRVEGTVTGGTLVGEVVGRHVIVLDDLCATGGTLIRAAEACKRAGAAAVHVAVTHAPLAEGIEKLMSSEQIASVLITDSVGIRLPASTAGKLATLSVAPLFGEAVRRIIAGKSLAPLLSRWPVG
jgi:ribose-phosphate pyrophosphokinase